MTPTDVESRTTAEERMLTREACSALDASIDHLDATTLSRLNRARHQALEHAGRGLLQRAWLPLTAVALASLVVAVTLPALHQRAPVAPAEPSLESAYTVTADDLELVEDLDLVLSLLESEDHAS